MPRNVSDVCRWMRILASPERSTIGWMQSRFGAASQQPTMPTYERATVLVVEDDRALREMLDYALRMEGYAVWLAADGLAALRLLDQQIPDVIVLDLDLPHISGMDVQQEVVAHAETREIPIIVVTATDLDVQATVFRTLRKPVTPEVVIGIIEQALRRHDLLDDQTKRRA